MLQNKSKIQMEPQTGVTFDDVAGCDASKLELEEVVDFLSNPEKYDKVGAQAPRGVMLEGPPGTGKTLLARAVAGEAGVPFISCSGSEFVEMFVGVGASRIRSLFADAKKNAPCIIFIDEIDAIGRQRASGGGFAGANDEREQTLNQILTEMDGFTGNTGVIVIAATNRADVLDSALIRPGRFDRRVPVDLPDKAGRIAILKVHVRDKPLAADVDLDAIASRAIGFSGASLQNLMNEAAIVAARREKDVITFDEIDFAIDRLQVGMQKPTTQGYQNKENARKRQELVAWHEAGHAVMAALTPGYDGVAKVTIIPRTNGAGGFTLFTPSEDRMESGLYSYKFLKGQLAVALGGRVAEELAVGKEEVTTGASNDLQQVRDLARRMIAQWGFLADESQRANANALRAPTAWETPDGNAQMGGPQTASNGTERLIDEETKKLVQQAYDTCYETLSANRSLMEKVVDRLIENETVDGGEFQTMVLEHTSQQQVPAAAFATTPSRPSATVVAKTAAKAAGAAALSTSLAFSSVPANAAPGDTIRRTAPREGKEYADEKKQNAAQVFLPEHAVGGPRDIFGQVRAEDELEHIVPGEAHHIGEEITGGAPRFSPCRKLRNLCEDVPWFVLGDLRVADGRDGATERAGTKKRGRLGEVVLAAIL
jgi:cell division protease FtsH